jgi:hypothetical protein
MTDGGRKYLIETSAVPAATNASTEEHGRHYADAVREGQQWTSIYIRKEFIARFFCELAYVASYIGLRTSVRDALILLAQRYSIREIKVDMTAIALLLDQRTAMDNPHIAAEEVARLAINWLKTFDRVFRNRIPNTCGCQIGHKRPSIDYNTLLKDLSDFYEDFTEPVDDCPVNDLVGIGDPAGRGQALVAEKKTQKVDSVKNLAELLAAGARFVCDECRRIGDAVIALEQPADACLVHIDKAYTKFCPFLGREHKHIKSALAIEKEVIAAAGKQKGDEGSSVSAGAQD